MKSEINNNIEELKIRWTSESPTFWKRVLKMAIMIGSSAVAVIAADQLFNLRDYGVHDLIFTVAGYIVVACAALGLSAKITIKE